MNIALLENPDIWLVIGTVLIIVEIFIGSLVLFLPVGIAGICVGLIFKLQVNFDFIIISNWAYALVIWGIISLILSLLLQKYFKKEDEEDINSYWLSLKKSRIVFISDMSFSELSPNLDFSSTSLFSRYCLPIIMLRGTPISSESFIFLP